MRPDPPIRRRSLLAAMAAAGAAGGVPACSAPDSPTAPAVSAPQVTHQPGVVSPPLPAVVLAAFDVTATDREGLTAALRELAAPVAGAVTTVAVGASLFDGRFELTAPRLLTPMPGFAGDAMDPAWCHGDVLVQVTGTDAASLDLPRITGLRPRWRIDGFHPRDRGDGIRNLFGFREGTGNPESSDAALMNDLVWVQPDSGEPAWCTGGTYQVVRLIRLAMTGWDRRPRSEQEEVFGRDKHTGAPLGQQVATDPPDFTGDPDGRTIALNAHIRRANPRTPEAMQHRILRRSWSYTLGEDAGQIFTCYQRDVVQGFAAIQQRLTGEALERYLLPFGGGYYFVPAADRLGLA